MGSRVQITPLGDIPSIGRKPLLILTTATAAFSLVILAIWNESKLALYVATFILSLFSTPYMGIVVTVDCIACSNGAPLLTRATELSSRENHIVHRVSSRS